MPLVSIVIPCCNADKYIAEAIESALAQTYPNKEIVVIDDGSTDGSLDSIRSFGDRVCWESGPNRGGGAARNRGIQLAQGELIQFLDADDILYPCKLERQICRIMEVGDGIVFCDRVERMPDAESGFEVSFSVTSRDSLVQILSGHIQTSAPIHRKDNLLKVGGFREDLPCAQEFDLHLRQAAAGYEFHHLPEALYELRKRDDSVSSNYERVLDQYATILWPVFEQLQTSGQMSDERRTAFAHRMANAGRSYMRMGRCEKGLRYFDEAAKMDPNAWMKVYSRSSLVLRGIVGPCFLEKLVLVRRMIFRQRARRSNVRFP